LADRVSELAFDNDGNATVKLAGADAGVLVRLGRDDLTNRLRQGLQALDEQRQTPRGAQVNGIDLRPGGRAMVCFGAPQNLPASQPTWPDLAARAQPARLPQLSERPDPYTQAGWAERDALAQGQQDPNARLR